jgi:hypothetical protein
MALQMVLLDVLCKPEEMQPSETGTAQSRAGDLDGLVTECQEAISNAFHDIKPLRGCET